ncbi:GNAT family N-acetyltransferase [Aquimarina sp. 2-A2]|uniref:GNAT family N-acetyltransferase n=1 Tax=Aquimarina sp. 2-A2 TaxID=3382644 RepID=UPI00387F08AF
MNSKAFEIKYALSETDTELREILRLQNQNLAKNISTEEIRKEGFVTVHHTFEVLKKMNLIESHVLAKHRGRVVGYALSMSTELKNEIEELKPMFTLIDRAIKNDRTYLVMGQVCIDKAYRKQGIFKGLYCKMQECYRKKYEVLITEISSNNKRSLNAHHAVGFETLLSHKVSNTTWEIVEWKW